MSRLSITDLNFCESAFSGSCEVKGGRSLNLQGGMLDVPFEVQDALNPLANALGNIPKNQKDTGNFELSKRNWSFSSSGRTVSI